MIVHHLPVRAEAPAEAGGAEESSRRQVHKPSCRVPTRAQEPFRLSGPGRGSTRSVPLWLVFLLIGAAGAVLGLVEQSERPNNENQD